MRSLKLTLLLALFALIVTGMLLSGCKPATPTAPARPSAQQVREQQIQRQILERREKARKSNRTHTAH